MFPGFLLFLLIVLGSCSSSMNPFHQEGSYEKSVALRELSNEIDEIKASLEHLHIEISALEDRIQGQESELVTLQQGTRSPSQPSSEIVSLEKRLDALKETHGKTLLDLKALTAHAQKTSSSLAAYRDKIEELEQRLEGQDRRLFEVGKVKETLTSLTTALKNPSNGLSYTLYKVQGGETLGKIAKEHRTTVRAVKELNHLSGNQIYAGQELKLPN